MEGTGRTMDHYAHRPCKQRHEECPSTSGGYRMGVQQAGHKRSRKALCRIHRPIERRSAGRIAGRHVAGQLGVRDTDLDREYGTGIPQHDGLRPAPLATGTYWICHRLSGDHVALPARLAWNNKRTGGKPFLQAHGGTGQGNRAIRYIRDCCWRCIPGRHHGIFQACRHTHVRVLAA